MAGGRPGSAGGEGERAPHCQAPGAVGPQFGVPGRGDGAADIKVGVVEERADHPVIEAPGHGLQLNMDFIRSNDERD